MATGLTDTAICLIPVLLLGITYIVWQGLKITQIQHVHAMAALASLGDTHKLGLDGLMLTIQRMEKRISALEDRAGISRSP